MRGLLLILRKSLARHRLSTAVTILSLALGSGLVMAVFALAQQSRESFTGGAGDFDAVFGARGSALQLVLNTVFHLETSPGNIPFTEYERLRDDPRIDLALPYAVGDSYRGFRVVGTTADVFDAFELEVRPGGRPFDVTRQEAVVGYSVARETGLVLGERFQPSHGVVEAGGHSHAEEYLVVGVLEPTGSPVDRVVWIPLEGMYHLDGHVLRGAGENYHPEAGVDIPSEHKEVSAVLLRLRSPQVGFQLFQETNRGGKLYTLAWPIGATMADLFLKLGWMSRVLEAVAYLVVLVAAGSVLASLYNSMKERRRELAVLRALGARRATVFGSIIAESLFISVAGCALGYAVYLGILYGAATWVRARTGVVIELFEPHPVLWMTPIGMALVGILAGLLPAREAYRTEVVRTLADA